MFVNYNDYELIYLYNEGENKALNILFKKYEPCIYHIVNDIYKYGDKSDDLCQEGRIVLFDCIKHYSPEPNVSFYSYFLICLRRRINKLSNSDYYTNTIYLNENINIYSRNIENNSLLKLFNSIFKNDKLAMIIWDYHMVRGISIRQIAYDFKIDYFKLFRKKESILSTLKKYIDYL